jgi:hypothetical protein
LDGATAGSSCVDVKVADLFARALATGVPDEQVGIFFSPISAVRHVNYYPPATTEDQAFVRVGRGILAFLRRSTDRVEKSEVHRLAVAGCVRGNAPLVSSSRREWF